MNRIIRCAGAAHGAELWGESQETGDRSQEKIAARVQGSGFNSKFEGVSLPRRSLSVGGKSAAFAINQLRRARGDESLRSFTGCNRPRTRPRRRPRILLIY
jgi:hypothetical protein